jgi:glycosyltransferase involved in cell wall biosynthesis
MQHRESILVIIPTLATKERGDYLHRAIDSVISQREVRAIPLVVANGPNCDPSILESLHSNNKIRFEYNNEASMPKALLTGREIVDTPFYSELDDDDMLLPDALKIRLNVMQHKPDTDVVITSGFISNGKKQIINIIDFSEIQSNPLHTLMKTNWFLPGSALFRTATVTQDFFEGMPKYLEWTYLAYRLSSSKKISFVNTPTLVHYTHHSFSIWNSKERIISQPNAIEQIMQLELPNEIIDHFKLQLAAANNNVAANYRIIRIHLKKHEYRFAWPLIKELVKSKDGWMFAFKLIQGKILSVSRRFFRMNSA